MNDTNSLVVTGRLTKDSEFKHTNSGVPVCTFSVAVNRSFKEKEEWKEEVSFFEVKAWGNLAEKKASKCIKGNHVFVIGEMRQDRWSSESGENKQKVYILAHSIHLIENTQYEKKQEVQPENIKISDNFNDDIVF